MGLVAKAFQDIITFSRASSGTYVNNNGYITNSSVLNYLTYSNQPENAAWTKSNSFVQQNLAINSQDFDLWSLGAGVTVAPNTTIAPDGTLTADRITFTAGGSLEFVRRSATLTVGVVYTASVYAQIASGTPTFIFDAGNAIPSTAQTPTSAWQRFTFTFTFSGANQWVDLEASGAGTIAFWGFQLVQGSVPGDYRATTSVTLPILYPDYNGALRARKLCETAITGTHNISQNATVVGSAIYTDSIYVKAGERTSCRVINYDNGANYAWIYVDLTNGNTLNSGVTGTVSNQSFTVTSAGLGWYRISIVAGLAATTRQLRIDTAVGASETTTGDGSSGIYIADAQLNDSSSALAYYDTTASAYNAPRFDYDPATLAAKGLLVEEQRTNLLIHSAQFDISSWAKTNIAVTANTVTAPDGTMAGDTITATSVGSNVGFIAQSFTATASTTYTFSVYVKHGTESAVMLQQICTVGGISSGCTANFNLVAGTTSGLTNYGGITGATANILAAGNGWYRCTLIMPVPAGAITSAATWFFPYAGADPAGTYAYMWGAQLEVGAFATSYIPTVASQVTRAADVASVNTLSPWFNQAGGTIYVEADTFEPSVVAVRNAVAINDGSSNNVHRVLSYGGKIGGNTITASATVADLQPLTYTTNTTFKFAYAYAANDFAAVGNGGAPSTDVLGALPTGLTTMGIGNLSGVIWCGHMRRITYYPRRLTNAELQTLTTL